MGEFACNILPHILCYYRKRKACLQLAKMHLYAQISILNFNSIPDMDYSTFLRSHYTVPYSETAGLASRLTH